MELPADVRALITEQAAFLYAATTGGSAWDLEFSVEQFPETPYWGAFLSAKGIDVDEDDDEYGVDNFPLFTEDEERQDAMKKALVEELDGLREQGPAPSGPGTLAALVAALDELVPRQDFGYDFDNCFGGDGLDAREEFDRCEEAAAAGGGTYFTLKIWVENLMDVWVGGDELETETFSWPLPWEMDLAVKEHFMGEVNEKLDEHGFTGLWTPETGLRIRGLTAFRP